MDDETAPASIEQYVIKEKYAEAAKEAVEACAAETRGQTCYFCLDDGESEGGVESDGGGDGGGGASGHEVPTWRAMHVHPVYAVASPLAR